MKLFDLYDVMQKDFKIKIAQELSDMRWNVFKGGKDIRDTQDEVEEELKDTMKSFFKEIQDEQFHFEDAVNELEDEVNSFSNFTDLSDAQTINEAALSICEFAV